MCLLLTETQIHFWENSLQKGIFSISEMEKLSHISNKIIHLHRWVLSGTVERRSLHFQLYNPTTSFEVNFHFSMLCRDGCLQTGHSWLWQGRSAAVKGASVSCKPWYRHWTPSKAADWGWKGLCESRAMKGSGHGGMLAGLSDAPWLVATYRVLALNLNLLVFFDKTGRPAIRKARLAIGNPTGASFSHWKALISDWFFHGSSRVALSHGSSVLEDVWLLSPSSSLSNKSLDL